MEKENFINLKDYEIDNETHEYLAEVYSKVWLSPTYALSKKDLYDIGLSNEVSSKLFDVLEPLLNTCYTNEQLLECGLEYLFSKSRAISSKEMRYFISNVQNDTWVKHEIYGACYNITLDTDSHMRLNKSINELEKDDYTMFYHCTNWNSCLKILKYGSVSYLGKKCLDFGVLPSFYLTPDINAALSWGKKNGKRWENEIATLVYRVSKKLLASTVKKYKVKYFACANDEWKQLTTSSRRCTEPYNELDKYDFTYGPIVSNIQQIDKQEAQPYYPIVYQLAAKSEKANKYLKRNYVGSVWFEKK